MRILGLLGAVMGCGLLQTPAVAGSQHLGELSMYLCDNGEDLCSNTLTIPPTEEFHGPFTDTFTFDFSNSFPGPNNVPVLSVNISWTVGELSQGDVSLLDPSGDPVGSVVWGDGKARVMGLIDPGDGLRP